MNEKAKWPISNVEQDVVAYDALITMLERMIGAVDDETRVMYWYPLEDREGGSLEVHFLCDYLCDNQLDLLQKLYSPIPLDGQPSVDVQIRYIWDEEYKKHLLEKWEARGGDRFIEHFDVVISLTYTKGDWEKLVGKNELPSMNDIVRRDDGKSP